MGVKESQKIIEFLSSNGFAFRVLEHAPVHTSEQAAMVRNALLRQGVKAIVLKTSSNDFLLACVSGDKRIDLKRLSEILGVKRVFLASQSEVLEQTGCEVGSVAPLGNLFSLKTVFDKRILENEVVEFNIGLHTKSIRMKARDLVMSVGAAIADFAME